MDSTRQARAAVAQSRGRFFANTALLMAALVVLSFPMTYFGPLATGSRKFALLHHLHGTAFFVWMGLYVWQTRLVAANRVKLHRELGLAVIALSGAMVPLGLWMAVHAIEGRVAEHFPLPFEFTLYNLVDITLFAGFMAAAVAQVSRSIEWHRRLVYAAALNLVGPAISRWFGMMPLPFPVFDFAPNIAADLLLIALAIHDVRTSGRVHRATLIAAAVMIPLHFVEPFLARSDAWNALAPHLFGFA